MEASEFSLEFFKESAGGDKNFLRRLLGLTAQTLQQYLSQFILAAQTRNREQMQRAAHKLHPHLEALQADWLQALIGQLLVLPEDEPLDELLQAFQQKAALLCGKIQQAAENEKLCSD